MYKYLILLCLGVSAIQAVPTYNQDKNVLAKSESMLETLQRLQALLERLNTTVVGDLVDLGAPLYVIQAAIETILNSEGIRSCVSDTVEEIGNDIAVELADDFEKLLEIMLEREEKIEACSQLPVAAEACRTSVQVKYAVRILQAAAEVTDKLDTISADLQQKVFNCIRRSA